MEPGTQLLPDFVGNGGIMLEMDAPIHVPAKSGRIILRLASREDGDLLWCWRNDPVTRQNSHCTDEVNKNDHQAWLAASLANPARTIFIGEVNGAAVGTVRCDCKPGSPGRVELSWTVAPELRGRGLGTELVRCAAEIFLGYELYAEIKATNAASFVIARHVGMTQVGYEDGVTYWLKDGNPGVGHAPATDNRPERVGGVSLPMFPTGI
jgi:RimJ/RimL family protein N-acetyltransferase